MVGLEFTLFATALGPCALVWSKQGVVGFQLPERDEQATLEKLSQRFPAAAPVKPAGANARCVASLTRLLAGKASDLSQVKLDVSSAPAFHQRVYQVVQQIPRGTTLSYGEVAALAGSPGASRAVGQAMAKNPVALIVPCHRVTAASGKLGGFTAYGGAATKQALLELEGCAPAGTKTAAAAKAPAAKAARAPAAKAARAPAAKAARAPAAKAARAPAAKTRAATASAAKPRTAAPPPAAPRTAAPAAPVDAALAMGTLSKADPVLGALIQRVGPYTLELGGARNVFEGLARAIVFQQLNGKAAATIYGRLCDALSGDASAAVKGRPSTPARGPALGAPRHPSPESILAASEATIASAGISGAKQRALRDLAERTLNKSLPTLRAMQRMSDEAIIEQLTAVRGIGRWSAQMFLMFQLGRPDVLPLGDYSVRKAFADLYGLPSLASEQQVQEHGERWAPYRSVASWYLWRSLE